ncbi:MAG TPA: hypothetical protein VFU65_10645 [Actinocrinis sp.]|nr:hypothetical protein [Actinocrinis sp.]
MGDQYSLTLKNRSPQPGLTFAVYTVAPDGISDAADSYPIAWLTKALNEGNDVTFTWTLEFTLMFASMGAESGTVWKEHGALAVNDNSSSRNSAQLGFEHGDYTFRLNNGAHPVKPGHVYLDTTSQVPSWTAENGPSVALAIATGKDNVPRPAIAGNSGPLLHHRFDLHPTYYIRAGHMDQGEMADLDTVTEGQKVIFAAGVTDSTWTFNADNTWSQG